MTTVPPDGRDWDAEFAEITSHLETPPETTPSFSHAWHPEPGQADEARSQHAAGPDGSEVSNTTLDVAPTTAARSLSPEASVTHLDEIDTFVPPDPTPLTRDDPATTIMIAALVLGPLWLLYLVIFARETTTLWWVLAALITTAGFVLAVARQPRSRDEDDLDDGARV